MATNLSPGVSLVAGGEPRLLADIGRIDADAIGGYLETGGYAGLRRAIEQLSPERVIDLVEAAGLRGRGGAGYPTADKWWRARRTDANRRIVVVNVMGADPSALGDRALAEGNPHLIIEGALIAAFAVGAGEAIIAVRRDWTLAIERLRQAIREADDAHLAGPLILGTDVSVALSVWEGSGAYVAGEETALIHALQGDRGMPLIRPPYPAERGLWGVPTVMQGAETLAHVAWILRNSDDAFRSVGSAASPGTKLVTLLGHVTRPGLLEVPLGAPLGAILEMGGGTNRAPTKAMFIGGPGGGAIAADVLDTPFDYEPLAAAGAVVGSGSILVTDANTCMVDTARFFLNYSSREACGKAVPCRIGTKRLLEAMDRILSARPRPDDFTLLRELSRKVSDTALCALEALAPQPMLTTLALFPEEYRAHAERGVCLAASSTATGVPPLLEPLPDIDGRPLLGDSSGASVP